MYNTHKNIYLDRYFIFWLSSRETLRFIDGQKKKKWQICENINEIKSSFAADLIRLHGNNVSVCSSVSVYFMVIPFSLFAFGFFYFHLLPNIFQILASRWIERKINKSKWITTVIAVWLNGFIFTAANICFDNALSHYLSHSFSFFFSPRKDTHTYILHISKRFINKHYGHSYFSITLPYLSN